MDITTLLWENQWKVIITYLIVHFLIKFIVKPYKSLFYYKKQGIVPYYPFPLLGSIIKHGMDQKKRNDFFLIQKQFYLKNPQIPIGYSGLFLSSPAVVFTDPTLIGEFLSQWEEYEKFDFGMDIFQKVMGKGLLFTEGEQYKARRLKYSGIFTFEKFKDSSTFINELTIEKLTSSITEGKEINIIKTLSDITGTVSLMIFLGPTMLQKSLWGLSIKDAFQKFQTDMNKTLMTPLFLIFGARFFNWDIRQHDRDLKKSHKELQDFIKTLIIDQINDQGETKDKMTLTKLLHQQNAINFENDGQVDQLIQNIFTFSLGGKDTTATFVNMFMYYMAKNPEISQKLQNQILKIAPTVSDFKFENLSQFSYLDACVNEVLRYYGPGVGLVNRVAKRDHKIGNVQILKGTLVNAGFLCNHYHEQNFTQPFEFRPERWLNEQERTQAYQPHVFVPFSGGSRNCIGQHLARIQSKIIICVFYQLFQSFRIPESYKLVLGITTQYQPINPIPFTFEKRQK